MPINAHKLKFYRVKQVKWIQMGSYYTATIDFRLDCPATYNNTGTAI